MSVECYRIGAIPDQERHGSSAGLPPLGRQSYDRDGIIVDYFLGTAWKRAEAATYADVRAILSPS